MSKLFAVVLGLQRPEIEQYCFHDCGKIIVGGLDDKQLGSLLPCRQETCPFLDKEMAEPFGEVDGETVYLRKLKGI